MTSVRRTAQEAEATRAALLDAGLAVFAERGYAAATLNEVAARARVTRGALYHHFDDKAALFLAAVEDRWLSVFKPLLSALDGPTSPLERLEVFLVGYFRAHEKSPRLRELLEVTMFRSETVPELSRGLKSKRDGLDRLAQQIATVLEEARALGELRPLAEPDVLASSLVAFMNGVTTTWLLAPTLLAPGRDASGLAAFALRALGSQPPAPRKHARRR